MPHGPTLSDRIIVPAHLRPQVGRAVVKHSLRTRDPRVAQAWALVLAHRYHQAFAAMGRAMADKTLEELLASAQKAQDGKGQEYKITRHRGGAFTVEANGPDDHAQAMQAMALMQNAPAPSAAPALPDAREIAAVLPVGIKRITLKKAVGEYLEIKDPNNQNATDKRRGVLVDPSKVKTFNQIKKANNDFVEWCGERTTVTAIQQHDLSKYAAHLLTQIGKGTAKTRLSWIAGFFDWAEKSQYSARDGDMARGHIPISTRDKRESAQKGWQRFTPEHLAKIFQPENFKKLTRQSTRWIAVMELYTGARPNELAQIDLIDFSESDGRLCVKITGVGDQKRTKNEHSERTIPIHPDLIALGLMDKISAQRAAGQTRLFPDLNRQTQNGPAQAAGKDFTTYLKELEITPRGNGKIGIRSFRPTVITQLAEAGVAQGWRERFVGHEQSEGTGTLDSDHDQRYTQSQLIGVLAERCFPALNWTDQKIIRFDAVKRLLK